MTDIISAIDAATGCQQCGNPLGSSPSSDFCGEGCQHAWHAGRVREPEFAAAIASAVDQLAQVCGVPREILGQADDTEDAADPPGTVHVRGDGTSYMPRPLNEPEPHPTWRDLSAALRAFYRYRGV